MSRQRVAVIGAGIVGATIALELLQAGQDVTIIEPERPGGEHAASYGNGGWVSSSLLVPASVPGLWRSVPRYLTPSGPLSIRLTYLHEFFPWLCRFIAAGATEKRVLKISAAMKTLVADASQRHLDIAARVGAATLFERTSLIHVFRHRSEFDENQVAWRLRREHGVLWEELCQEELQSREPDLDRRYTFGVAVEGVVCRSPGSYVTAIVDHAISMGARLTADRATGFVVEAGKLQAVRLATGEIKCDRAVVCAGAWSKSLARAAGDTVPLTSERGYHVLIRDPEIALQNRILFHDAKLAMTRTDRGLRITGQAEFAPLSAPPNWKRARRMRDFVLASFRGMPPELSDEREKFWVGARPSTPDSLPVIGHASKSSDILYAFGHGHIGFCSAPASARLVADLLSGTTATINPEPFSPRRFSFYPKATRFGRNDARHDI